MNKEKLKKENAELKEKISVLLSCTNCPENKGGWICEKEYENKCLTQKIVYIKELEEEKCELLGIIQGKDKVIQELEKENAELKEKYVKECEDTMYVVTDYSKQLTKAKELIKEMLSILPKENIEGVYEITEEAEQFLNEVEKPIESSVDHIIEQNEKEVGLNPDYFLGGW